MSGPNAAPIVGRRRSKTGRTLRTATARRAKLTANDFNSVATSISAIGALAPLVAFVSGQLVVRNSGWVAGLVVAAFAPSLAAHLGARYVLRREFRR